MSDQTSPVPPGQVQPVVRRCCGTCMEWAGKSKPPGSFPYQQCLRDSTGQSTRSADDVCGNWWTYPPPNRALCVNEDVGGEGGEVSARTLMAAVVRVDGGRCVCCGEHMRNWDGKTPHCQACRRLMVCDEPAKPVVTSEREQPRWSGSWDNAVRAVEEAGR